jgi:DNA-binding NtrC family response regulator
LSQSGIGLIGSPKVSEGPLEGQTIELELRLPTDEVPLLARGSVRWRHDARDQGHASTAFGVVFTGFDDDGALRLARYLAGPPVRVAVAFADQATRELIEAALSDVVQLEFCDENPEVEAILGRGDIASLVICGLDEVRALLLAQLAAAVTEDNLNFEGRPRDLAARVVFCAQADPVHVAALFDEKKIHRRLEPGFTQERLRAAVMDACAEHSHRLEQERMAQELERNLYRERALRAGPQARPFEAGPGFQSPAMQAVLEQVRTVAPYKVAVLLQGETGTGKEVLARIIHRVSERRDRPFVVQDCGVLTETLLESELFGHVRGAFTGAVSDHPGLFALADGGTVFLDEIENTTPALQAKLLRVLETGEVRAVGGTQVRRVDVRLVTASNRDLSSDVEAGRFRSDLFFRLNTFTIEVAPLRQRREDVVPLARYFVDLFNHQHAKGVMGLSAATERALLTSPFPGNVRELRNLIERAVLLCATGALIEPAHLPRSAGAKAPGSVTLKALLAQAEREAISTVLIRHRGIARRAALELGMDPVTFSRRARRLGLAPGVVREPAAARAVKP